MYHKLDSECSTSNVEANGAKHNTLLRLKGTSPSVKQYVGLMECNKKISYGLFFYSVEGACILGEIAQGKGQKYLWDMM